MSYSVIVPLVVATQEDGSHAYLYQGAPVPGSVHEDEIKRLADGGFIVKDKTAEVVEIPDGDPTEEWTAKQLDAYADAKGIDIKSAKNKTEKLAALTAPSA